MCWWLSRSRRTPLPGRSGPREPFVRGHVLQERQPRPGFRPDRAIYPVMCLRCRCSLAPRSRHDLVNATAQVLQAARGPRVGREYSPFLRAHGLAAWPTARAEGRRPSHTGDEALDRHWPVTAGHQLSEPAGCDSRRAAADYACAQPATPSP
jgi:hypothetical protein